MRCLLVSVCLLVLLLGGLFSWCFSLVLGCWFVVAWFVLAVWVDCVCFVCGLVGLGGVLCCSGLAVLLRGFGCSFGLLWVVFVFGWLVWFGVGALCLACLGCLIVGGYSLAVLVGLVVTCFSGVAVGGWWLVGLSFSWFLFWVDCCISVSYAVGFGWIFGLLCCCCGLPVACLWWVAPAVCCLRGAGGLPVVVAL